MKIKDKRKICIFTDHTWCDIENIGNFVDETESEEFFVREVDSSLSDDDINKIVLVETLQWQH